MAEEARRFMNEEESNEVPENVEVTVENIVENNNNIIEKRSRNKKDIFNIALASIRHHTGLRETAEIATAAWIDGGLTTEDDTHLVIDHNKVKRAQDKIMAELNEKFEEELKVKGISCIFFDGRRDDTKVMLEMEGTTTVFPGMVKKSTTLYVVSQVENISGILLLRKKKMKRNMQKSLLIILLSG